MQKKSLLVALFCGALCLTGCLKNEESASVAQVRIAKANELNSIADLNKAKAAAEAVYAQAELTIANAEAKLREANANLVNAQAETEKVRAELLKVQVALAEVTVEEEKVKLQLLEADLEKHLAEVEAAIAKAEAEKQEHINEIEHQVALAEKQALKDALEILKAEDKLQEYVLKQAGTEAENAKAAGVKYFAALDEIQKLQLKSIRTKAEKALVEAGAIGIRDAIHFEMEQIDEEIAKKEALLAYLKEYQEMTPEEAEAALIEARVKLTDAYNAYQDALALENEAKKAYEEIDKYNGQTGKGLVSAFTYDWDDQFTDFIEDNWGRTYSWRGRDGRWHSRYVSYVDDVDFVDYEGFDAVKYFGYVDPSDPTKFIKLWKTEQPLTNSVPYPTIEEQSVRPFPFKWVDEMVIAPAEIYYENVEAVLDSIVARQQAQVAKDVQSAKDASAANVKGWQKTIDDNKVALALHQEYVDKRKDTVAKYESDLAALVEAYNKSQAGHATALEEYLHYMVMNYEVPTSYFEEEIIAAQDTVEASSKYFAALKKWEDKKAVLETTLTTEKKNAHDADSVAKAEYTTANGIATNLWTNGTYNTDYSSAADEWSPFFAGSYKKVSTKGSGVPYYYDYKERGTTHKTYVEHVTAAIDTTGSSQYDWLVALGNEEDAKKAWDAAKAAYEANPTTDNENAKNNAKATYDGKVTDTETAYIAMEQKRGLFEAQQNTYDYIWGRVEEAKKAYNPDFANNKYSDADVKYDATKGEWYKMDGTKKNVAGTAQGAKFMADSLYDAAKYQVTERGTVEEPTLFGDKEAKKGVYTTKKEAWGIKFAALVKALNTTAKDYKADPKVAELYAATQKPTEATTKYLAKWDQLRMLYGLLQNEEGVYINYIAPTEAYYGHPYDTPRGWNQRVGLSWLNSNFHLNPEFEYVSDVDYDSTEGKVVIKKSPVATLLYPNRQGGMRNSLTAINDWNAQRIANEPARLEKEIDGIENSQAVQTLNNNVAAVKAALKEYQGFESEYNTWVEARETAFEAWNEAKKVTFDAKDEADLAEESYKALKATADGKMWVYAPEAPNHNEDGFIEISVNDAIEKLEGDTKDLFVISGGLMELAGDALAATADEKVTPKEIGAIWQDIAAIDFEDLNSIAGLNFTKALFQKALQVGKVTLQVVLDAFDAELAVIDEQIALQTKVAAVYKAIMNGWLGIVDDEDVNGETGPVDGEGEGDDEE